MALAVHLDFNTTCRLCLSQEGLLPLFPDIETPEEIFVDHSLPTKILACVSIEVSQESNLPKNICDACMKSIDDWAKFKEQCDRANSTLLDFVESQKSIYVEYLQSEADNDPNEGVLEHGEDDQSANGDVPLSPSSDKEHKDSPRKARSCVRIRKDDEDSPAGSNKKKIRRFKIVKKTKRVKTVVKKEVKTEKDPLEIDECDLNSDDNHDSSENCEPTENHDSSENCEPTESKWKLLYERYQKKKYVCGVNGCDKIVSRFCDLIRHDMADHADVPLDVTCDVCGKLFISDDRLQIHMNTYHGEKKFTCDVCGDKFLTKDSLRSHKRRHSGRFVCQYCGLAANSNMVLVEHIRTHTGERPFVCDICGQKCSTKNGLNSHKRSHTKEHLFKCNICGYSSSNQSSMYMHKSTHSSDKPCICETCGKRFKIPVRLAEHKKIHTGIKNFMCEECDMAFLTRYQLTQHARIHSGEKPFECETCQKKFSRRDNLQEHIRTHTLEKRYTCSLCLKVFSFRKSLNKHHCPQDVANVVAAYEETGNDVVMYCQL